MIKVKINSSSHTSNSLLSQDVRHCLQELLDESHIKVASLEITDHLHLSEDENCLVSLAHTKNLVAAAISVDSSIKSIGVDIEWKERRITEGAHKFFRNNEDEFTGELLELWCLKEAAFKALAPIDGEVTVLNHIWVKGFEFGKVGDSSVLGGLEVECGEFVLAKGWVFR